jgi:hypothetical protein
MKYNIKYRELSEFLSKLDRTDFYRDYEDSDNVKLKRGFGMDDIEYFKKDISKIPKDQIIYYGMPFLVDAIGNQLSVCTLQKREFKLPTGRLVRMKLRETVINDCRKTYGTVMNGYWIIPSEFLEKK